MVHLSKVLLVMLFIAMVLSLPARTGPRAPTAAQVREAMQVRGVTPGQPFPYSIGGEMWRLRHFGVSVHGGHVVLDLDVEPM